MFYECVFFFFQAEDGIRDAQESRGLGDVYKRQVQREKLREILGLDEGFHIGYVIALGKPAETCLIEPLGQDGDIRYYRDAEGIHHVPKRSLDDLIV